MIEIFHRGNAVAAIDDLRMRFPEFSLGEIYKQFCAETGDVWEYQKKYFEKFSMKTENNELAHAITLADFYFPDSNPTICFEMKRGFRKKDVGTCEELIKNMESCTEVDCIVKDDSREFRFQLKQYPEKYKEWGVNEVIRYLDDEILTESKYNNKSNKDLIIVIHIQPERVSRFKESKDFSDIHKHLMSKDIKLLEINFLYNRNCESMIWYQVFPQKGYSKIPWEKLSYHKAKVNAVIT